MERIYAPRYRQLIGRPCRFANRDNLLVAISADPELGQQFICRRLAEQSVQAVVQKSASSVNTVNRTYVGKGVTHVEGGWPKDLNRLDDEQTQRYRKKIEKSATFQSQVNELVKTTEHAILQNNAVNIFENYFEDFGPLPNQSKSSARTIGVYKSPESVGRACTHIGWAEGGDFFVTSYRSRVDDRHDAYIWDPEYQNVPVYTLKSPKPAPCVDFNPKDIHTLASGLQSGQIAVWDTRAGNDPVQITERDQSHRSQVNCLQWTSTKTSSEFFTGSAEGDVFWWDLRRLEVPIDELQLDPKRDNRRSFGISVLEYEASIPTKFMAGSEQGVLFSCNKKGKTPAEKVMATVQCHYGPIYSLERNASFLKNYLTVGDWQAKIWTDECKEDAIVWSKSQKNALTSGCWSPTRCSTFFLTRMDGIFEIWDLLWQFDEKLFMLKVSDHPILCSRAHKTGRLLTMGAESGDVYQIEISESLTHGDSSERASFLTMLERETKRERLLESKHREVKLREKESERLRVQRAEEAVENAIAEEVLVQHAETAFLQHLSGDLEPERAKTVLAYMDAENEEILEGRSTISRKFKF